MVKVEPVVATNYPSRAYKGIVVTYSMTQSEHARPVLMVS
jgi:hypothetical protein